MKIVARALGALAVVVLAFIVLKETGLPIDTGFGSLGLDTSGILAPDCGKRASLDAELHVTSDIEGASTMWATDRESGRRVDLRFDGSLALGPTGEIVDAGTSRVVGRTGDLIVSGCYDLVQNAYQIGISDISPAP